MVWLVGFVMKNAPCRVLADGDQSKLDEARQIAESVVTDKMVQADDQGMLHYYKNRH